MKPGAHTVREEALCVRGYFTYNI